MIWRNFVSALACLFALTCLAHAQDVGANYVQGPGGYYRKDDRSGPYAIGPDGVPRLQALSTSTSGALEPATAPVGKITRVSTSVTANTSTTIASANVNRLALSIQCGSGAVSVDETGAALSTAAVGSGTLFIPSGSAPYFTPPMATQTAITAYTATAQVCVVTEYLR